MFNMATRPACTKDYENHAKFMLAPPTFEHIRGPEACQDDHHFNSVQLKLRGLANLKYFTDPIGSKILG